MPALSFTVERAEPVRFAAAPTLAFTLRIDNAGGEAIRSLALDAQIRIAATRRAYDAAAQARLADVFGEPERWSTTLHGLFWTRTTLIVPAFGERTTVSLPIACTYDFDVAASRYPDALADGAIPLDFLFSGSVFYTDAAAVLRVERIAWDREAAFELPVRTWKEALEQHFPDTAWVRLRRDTFARLAAYRARRALPTWEAALEALLARDAEVAA